MPQEAESEPAVTSFEPVGEPEPSPDVEQRAQTLRRLDISRHSIWLVASVLILLLSFILSVRGPEQVIVPGLEMALPGSCMFRNLAGVGCPGCGLTRCFISLAHGRLIDAWHFNPAGPLVFAIVALQLPYRSYNIWRRLNGQSGWEPRGGLGWVLVVGAIALLTQWVVRLMLGTVA